VKSEETIAETNCSGCGRRIPRSAPNILLADLLRGETRTYHEGCVDAAFELLSEVGKDGGQAFLMHHRTAHVEAN